MGDEQARVQSHASANPSGFPVPYANFFGTLTLDPMRNQQWIRDESNRYSAARARGALKDRQGLERALQYLPHELPPAMFEPTSKMLNALDKFTPKCNSKMAGAKTWGDPKLFGKLPVYSQLMWLDKYRSQGFDKDIGRINKEIALETEHFSRERTYDCSNGCR
jgi:hypothetical protein